MKAAIAGVVLLTLTGAARADDLRLVLSNVEVTPGMAAMWVDAVPKIATKCRLKVNRANFNIRRQEIERHLGTDIRMEMRMVESGAMRDNVLNAWQELYDAKGEVTACDQAIDLWGDNGTMYAGILAPR